MGEASSGYIAIICLGMLGKSGGWVCVCALGTHVM